MRLITTILLFVIGAALADGVSVSAVFWGYDGVELCSEPNNVPVDVNSVSFDCRQLTHREALDMLSTGWTRPWTMAEFAYLSRTWPGHDVLTSIAEAASSEADLFDAVWVTNTGRRYHCETCRYAANGHETTLFEALIANLTACAVCRPGE